MKESKDRVRTAIKNSGFRYPSARITINLAPADIKKEGPCFDLAIALGILAAQGEVNSQKLQQYIDENKIFFKSWIFLGILDKEIFSGMFKMVDLTMTDYILPKDLPHDIDSEL